MANHHRANNHC